MFVIKYDKISMIRFIQCIEKYPPIYNTKKHYSKEDIENAWDKIAHDVGEKDSLCREKWNSIKSCYVRHLKYSALNSKRRPYYLAEFLEFLKPFVSEKIRSVLSMKKYELKNLPTYLKEALPPPESTSSYLAQSFYGENNSEIKTEMVEIEKDGGSEWPGITCNNQPSSSKTKLKRSLASNCSKKNKELRETPPPASDDEDVTFFKSLLPDISRMSSHQKLKFKQETLSIIEDILYASDEINVCS